MQRISMDEEQKAEDLLFFSLQGESQIPLSMLSYAQTGDKRWEIIVKYRGDISQFESDEIKIESLEFGYAIVTLPQNRIADFLQYRQIEYAELPKALYVQDLSGNLASCINRIDYDFDNGKQSAQSDGDIYANADVFRNMTGEGVCIAIIDSGVDFFLPCFQTESKQSRFLFYYDQMTKKEYSNTEMNRLILQNEKNREIVPDLTGHGTKVCVIAAGNGRMSDGRTDSELIGVAPRASLLAVRLDTNGGEGFASTTAILRAFDYVLKKAKELQMPMVINLSFGTSYGPHDGSSLMEQYIDMVAKSGQLSVCIGAGNEASARRHAGGVCTQQEGTKAIYFNIGDYERESSLQIWLHSADQYELSLVSPNGERIGFFADGMKPYSVVDKLQGTTAQIYVGAASPYSVRREIMILFQGEYVASGTWTISIRPIAVKNGRFDLYLPPSAVGSRETVFLRPTPEFTMTIPGGANSAITVGAYHAGYRTYAEFSGRGFVASHDSFLFSVKPELVAPGVHVLTQDAFETSYENGTSFATPFVTGAIACLMEKGIVRGENPHLFADKLKAFLEMSAIALPQSPEINDKTGFGALCVSNRLLW